MRITHIPRCSPWARSVVSPPAGMAAAPRPARPTPAPLVARCPGVDGCAVNDSAPPPRSFMQPDPQRGGVGGGIHRR